MMDVVAPYGKRMLAPAFHDWYILLETSVAMDMRKLMPTIPWLNGVLRVRRELIGF